MRHLLFPGLQLSRLGYQIKTFFDMQEPTILFRDEFITTQPTPLGSTRNAEPGPGSWSIVDTGNRFSIADNKQRSSGGTDTNDPMMYSLEPYIRVPGLLLMVSHTSLATPATDTRVRYGLGNVGGISDPYNMLSILFHHLQTDLVITWANPDTPLGSALVNYQELIINSAEYKVAIMVREMGAFSFIKSDGHSEWEFVGISSEGAVSPVYLAKTGQGASTFNTDCEYVRLAEMGGAYPIWNSSLGPHVSYVSGSIVQGSVFSHPNPAVIEFDMIRSESNYVIIHFRKQDANNYLKLAFPPFGINTGIKISKVVAGVETQITFASLGPLVPIGHVYLIVDDKGIYLGRGNGMKSLPRIIPEFSTATQLEFNDYAVGGSISNLVIRDRVLSGQALDALLWLENLT